MRFSKRFPKEVPGSNYPIWKEVYLSEEEEKEIENNQRQENLELIRECLDDAKKIMADKKLKPFDTIKTQIAIALFEKRASHIVYHKEAKAKEKFDMKK